MPSAIAFLVNQAAMLTHSTTVSTEASAPNGPPLSSSGPEACALSRPSIFNPETNHNGQLIAEAAWVKFQAACSPNTNHNERVHTYAMPSSSPASSAMAIELHTVALGLP